MHTEVGDPGTVPDEDDVEGFEEEMQEETVVLSESPATDNVGDVSVEINVEELLEELETSQDIDAARRKEVRRRLEEIQEKKQAMKDLEDTYAMDLDDEVD